MAKRGKTDKQDKPLIDLSDFEEQMSLWQLIPAGNGEALKKLKLIVDSLLNSEIKMQNSCRGGKQGPRFLCRGLPLRMG